MACPLVGLSMPAEGSTVACHGSALRLWTLTRPGCQLWDCEHITEPPSGSVSSQFKGEAENELTGLLSRLENPTLITVCFHWHGCCCEGTSPEPR